MKFMDKELIEQQLYRYFDGLYLSDVNVLKKVFHDKAHYSCTTGGNLLHLSMPEYFERVKNRPSPASKNQTRKDQIIFIDVIGKYTALAKVKCVIEPKHFTDLLSLILIDGNWKVISKVFDYVVMPSIESNTLLNESH